MPFQWLDMRIGEERDRRRREAETLARLGPALDEMVRILGDCLGAYTSAFGDGSASLRREPGGVTVRVEDPAGEVRIATDTTLPGFQVSRDGAGLSIEIGLLPGNKLYYRDRNADQYLTMDELTRRILDRVLFPKLRE
jgi:hypothetical protein